jgi:DNA replication protein DnaC
MTDDNSDRYDRTNGASSLNALLGNVKEVEPPLLGRSLEWWEQRDREVAQSKAYLAERAEQHRMTERAGELRDNGFPEMFVTQALAGLRDTPAMKQARSFAAGIFPDNSSLPMKLLVLAGGVGAGKTTAATWVALKGADPRPAFVRIAELERRGRYDKNLDEWLRDKTSLVIDDVGAEVLDGKNVFRSLLDEIVDKFYSNRRTLVMTTNLRPIRLPENERKAPNDHQEQFYERYGERIWSRFSQAGLWADCGTSDLRQELQP